MSIVYGSGRMRQGGFTMVESLVALVILAIGLLGIAALYLDSLRAGRTAIYRTQAVTLAADLADRIRANRNAREAGYEIDFGDAAVEVAECLNTTGCSAVDMAATDLARWKDDLAAQLPGGDGSVTVTDGVGGEPTDYVISVQWSEVGQDDPLVFQLGFSS